jgi:hypothetical protein
MRVLRPLAVLASLVAVPALAETVEFEVEVPHCTPLGAPIHLRSNRLDPAVYQHDALSRVGPTTWRGRFEVTTPLDRFDYKYCHDECTEASCPGIEKALDYTGEDGERPSRRLSAGQTSARDRVLIWRSALRKADGAGFRPRSADELVAFCGPYVTVTAADGTPSIGYDAYDAGAVRLEWGRTSTYGRTLAQSGRHRNQFPLPELAPAETLHYRLVVDGAAGPDRRLRAPPAPGAAVRIGVLGDVEAGASEDVSTATALAGVLTSLEPELVLATGDLVDSLPGPGGPGGYRYPEPARFALFFGATAELLAAAPFVTAMGDREQDAPYFWDVFPFPTTDPPHSDHFELDYGDTRIFVLYTGVTAGYDRDGILRTQTPWLARALADAEATPRVRWRVVLVHRGPHSQGAAHAEEGGAFFETRLDGAPSWSDLLERHSVDLVLAGHDHALTVAASRGSHFLTLCSGAPPDDLRAPTLPTTLHAERGCHVALLRTGPTLRLDVRRPDGSPVPEAALELCHADADCAGLAHACPESVEWRCAERRCASTCVPAPPGPEALRVSPRALSLTATTGRSSETLGISLSGERGGAVAWTARCAEPWLRCAPSSGVTPARLEVGADAGRLEPGRYAGAVVLVGAATVAVELSVVRSSTGPVDPVDPPVPPVNRAPPPPGPLEPTDGERVPARGAALIVENAVDPDGDVGVSYRFELVPEARAAWRFEVAEGDGRTRLELPVLAPGPYRWRAWAVDPSGAVSAPSASRGFVVDPPDPQPAPESCGCDTTPGRLGLGARAGVAWLLVLSLALAVARRRHPGGPR